MPKGELHVELVVDYADDEKLVHVSRGARLLYVDALCLAKRLLNDGRITVAQVEKLAYPERPAVARKQATELVDSGAWVVDGDRYVIAAWLRRNRSRAQVQEARREAEIAAALGNHNRWHEARGVQDPRCGFCRRDPDRPPDRDGDRVDGTGANPTVSPETETETKDSIPTESSSPRATQRGTRLPTDFAVTPEMVAWARQHAPDVDGRRATAAFADYWHSKPGKEGRKLDWVATWRNWMRREQERRTRASPNGYSSQTDANIAALLNADAPQLRALPGGGW